ncbi:MAG: hypothetical protein SGILL_001639 [Bacillariaceae sp.]
MNNNSKSDAPVAMSTPTSKFEALDTTKMEEERKHLDVDTSWHRLSTSPALHASKKSARIYESDRHVARNTEAKKVSRTSARERKRQAEKNLGNSLAEFDGTTEDLQNIVAHARETLRMLPGTSANGTENDGSTTIASEFSRSLKQAQPPADDENAPIIRPANMRSCIVLSPQDLELDMLLSKMEEDPSFTLHFDFDVALRRASRSIDETLDSVGPVNQLPNVVYGSYLPWWRLEIILGEAEVFLGKEISAVVLSKIIDAANRLATQESVRVDNTPNSPQGVPAMNAPKSPTAKHLRQIDDLSQIYKTAYPSSPRPDLSQQPLPTLSPPGPPDFTALAAQRSLKRRSLQEIASRSGLDAEDEDDLSKLYRKAFDNEGGKIEHSDERPSFTERSPPKPSFGSLNSNERRTPILSRFLELNKRELLERTQSGREIPMVSPVTEPTMDSGSLLAERFLAFAQTIPDLEGAPEAEESETVLTDDPRKDLVRSESADVSLVDDNRESGAEGVDSSRESRGDSRSSRLEEASFDTYRELEAILLETKQEYGEDLSMDLVEAVKQVASSAKEQDSLGDSASLLLEHIATDSEAPSTDDSTLHGIAIELSRHFSTSANSEASYSLADLVHALRTKLAESKMTERKPGPTVLASKHFLDNLVNAANSELEEKLPSEIADKIRRSSLEADTTRVPPISWDRLEVLLHEACEGYDEDTWFEVQEAFFKAWESCSSSSISSRPVARKTANWGQASGYISAVSDGSVSALVDNSGDFDQFQDIFEEMQRIHGRVPQELLDRLKLEGSGTSTSISDSFEA